MYSAVELLDHMVILSLISLGAPFCFPYLSAFLHSHQQRLSVVSSPRFCQHFFKNSNRLTLVKGSISLWFWFTFAYCWATLNLFLCACGPFVCFFGEMSIQMSIQCFIVGLLVLLLLNCRSSLHTLAISHVSDIWFASIFSYSIDGHCTLLIVSWMRRGFTFCPSLIYFFKFCCLCFGCHMQGFIAKSNVMNSYSKRFIVLILAVRLFDPFWVNLHIWYKVGVQLHSFLWLSSFLRQFVEKTVLFPIEYALHPYQKIMWLYMQGFISGLYILFHWSRGLSLYP